MASPRGETEQRRHPWWRPAERRLGRGAYRVREGSHVHVIGLFAGSRELAYALPCCWVLSEVAHDAPPHRGDLADGAASVALGAAGTTMSMEAATVGTTKRADTFSPASSGSVHILVTAARALLAWMAHVGRLENV